jgi:hypothetical protein
MIETLPERIEASELLGRGVFDRSTAKDAARGKVPPKVFREKLGVRELSTDRLSFGELERIAQSHKGERREQDFHGWAVLTCADASLMGRTVVPNTIPPNSRWHAEILLPAFVGSDAKEDQVAHSVNLANHATWKPSPASPSL